MSVSLSLPVRRLLVWLLAPLLVIAGVAGSPPSASADPSPGGGGLSGLVTDLDGAPLGGVTVEAYSVDAPDVVAATAYTVGDGDAAGEYALSLAPGEYRLFFRAPDGYTSRWYGPGAGSRVAVADASVRLVPTRIGAAADSIISGTVEDPDGDYVDDIVVRARSGGRVVASSITYAGPDTDHGYFELHVPAGNYTLQFSDPAGRYRSQTADIGEVGESANVHTGSWGLHSTTETSAVVKGMLVDRDGNGLGGRRITLFAASSRDGSYRRVRPDVHTRPRGAHVGRFVRTISLPTDPAFVNFCAGPFHRRVCLGAVAVSAGGKTFLGTVTDGPGAEVGATVRTRNGDPVAGPILVPYVREGDTWTQLDEQLGGDDGHVSTRLPAGTYTFRFLRAAMQPVFLGGGSEMPGEPTPANSVVIGDDLTPVDLGTVTMVRQPTSFGTPVAGEYGPDHDFCLSNFLPANDDGSTGPVSVGFPLTFFGQPYSELYVNNNGNVTFGDSLSQYTPAAFGDGGSYDGPPIIAPFFADVDTRGLGSNVVTYGSNAAGTKLCVNWTDVGYYGSHADRLNSFQLILTKAAAGDREPGDFDMQFNYDRIQWETGDASDGTGGLGGTSALAGFTAGTPDVPGTVVQLDGSLVNGALLDDGPNALVAGTLNAGGRAGRYNFSVYNGAVAEFLGSLRGKVVDEDGDPVADALVEPCRVVSGVRRCSGAARTDVDGVFSFVGLVESDAYTLAVSPPAGTTYFPTAAPATVTRGVTTDLTDEPIVLHGPRPVPAGVTVGAAPSSDPGGFTPYVRDDGVLQMYWHTDLALSIAGCPGVVMPSFSFSVGGVVVDSGALTERPAGTYTATVTRPYPAHGDGSLTTNVPSTCDGTPVVFDVYIDPSGAVTDQFGQPLAGVTTTLLRSDTAGGPFAAVPDGDAIMSPANRTNPGITAANGLFAWDVLAGHYRVDATKTGCDPASTAEMAVPPERLALLIKMTCAAASVTPVTPATLGAGTPTVGTPMTVTPATWPGLIVPTRVEWRRGATVVGTALTYTPTGADVGQPLTVRTYGQRPDYRQENQADGDLVTFTETFASATSDAVVAAPGGGGGPVTPSVTNLTAPHITGPATVDSVLTADPGTWSTDNLMFTYQWMRAGSAIAGETGATYTPVAGDLGKAIGVTVVASRSGYDPGSAAAAPVTVLIGAAPVAGTAPLVSGTPEVGGTLHVSDGTWDLTGLTFVYQWLRDGEPITGATTASYVVTEADQGTQLAAVVTAAKAGHTDGIALASGVEVPEAPEPPAEPATSTTRARLLGHVVKQGERGTVRVRVSSDGDMPPTGTVTVTVGGRSVQVPVGERSKLTVALPKLKPGSYEVEVAYSGDDLTDPSSDVAGTLTVKKKHRHGGHGGHAHHGHHGTGRPMPSLI